MLIREFRVTQAECYIVLSERQGLFSLPDFGVDRWSSREERQVCVNDGASNKVDATLKSNPTCIENKG